MQKKNKKQQINSDEISKPFLTFLVLYIVKKGKKYPVHYNRGPKNWQTLTSKKLKQFFGIFFLSKMVNR